MRDPCEKCHMAWGLAEFRERFPGFRLTHLPNCALQFEGELAFRATKEGFDEIEDTYALRGIVPPKFPEEDAQIFETAGRIADEYHKMTNDQSLCLGSPIRIRKVMSERPTLTGLVKLLVIPYLYNHSYYKQTGELPVGELAHGVAGLIQDYEQLFSLKGADQCIAALELLGMKHKEANKRKCPCGSGRRLGRCHCKQLTPLRRIASRKTFKQHAEYLKK